jgi:hypothetical protein
VVVGVVDPGVGTDRRSVAVAVPGLPRPAGPGPAHLVGPDNGLLSLAADLLGGVTEAVALPAAEGACTFDGRDVFAPAAARLWLGEPLAALGTPVDPGALVHLPPARCQVGTGSITTEVQWVDRFGNAQLAARPDDLAAAGLTGTALTLTVVAAADQSTGVTSGADRSPTLSSGADRSPTLSSGADRSPTLSSGADQSPTPSSGADQSPTPSSGADRSPTLSSGADLGQAPSSGGDQSPTPSSGGDLGQAAGFRAPGQGAAPSVLLRRARTFDDVGHGFGLVVDASGWLAVVRRQASAAAELGVQAGVVVTLRGDGGRDEGGRT